MKRLLLILSSLLILSTLFYCNTEPERKGKPDYTKGEVFETKTGTQFILFQHETKKMDKPNIEVKLKGFSETNQGFTFKFSDPIEEAFLMDLDSNGYEELYIITRSNNKSHTALIQGMASNVDKSASQIFTPDYRFKSQSKTSFFEGFGGNNTFYRNKGVILEKYPIENKVNDLGQKLVEGIVTYDLELYGGNGH